MRKTMELKFSDRDKNLLKPVHEFARKRRAKLYLVGGALRDLMLGRSKENPDFDFCLKKGAIAFGRSLARKMKAGFVVLDEDHAACRLVRKQDGRIYTFDFTDFRAETLEKDLSCRDFTMNAMAVELSGVFGEGDISASISDPYSGRRDLEKKIIRVCGKKTFKDDPLRILRAFSFSCMPGFKPDKQTLSACGKERRLIRKVSSERVREELFKIFDSPSSHSVFLGMDKLKILEVVFPEINPMRKIGQGPHHHLDVWQHTMETLRQFELMLPEARRSRDIDSYLNEELSGQRKRLSLLKFACILHDTGKPKSLRREKGKITFHGHERIGLGITREVCRRLKLANDETRSLERIVLWHLRPGYLAGCQRPTERAVFRFFRDTGKDALAVLLLSLADQRATKGPLATASSRLRHEKTVSSLIRRLLKKSKESKPAPLLNGHDIMRKFKLAPGPLIGIALKGLEEAQAIGRIRGKEGAFKLAAKIIKQNK